MFGTISIKQSLSSWSALSKHVVSLFEQPNGAVPNFTMSMEWKNLCGCTTTSTRPSKFGIRTLYPHVGTIIGCSLVGLPDNTAEAVAISTPLCFSNVLQVTCLLDAGMCSTGSTNSRVYESVDSSTL